MQGLCLVDMSLLGGLAHTRVELMKPHAPTKQEAAFLAAARLTIVNESIADGHVPGSLGNEIWFRGLEIPLLMKCADGMLLTQVFSVHIRVLSSWTAQ